MLADDLPWNGPSSFGNKHVQTPNIDRLAQEGMKFTQAYAAPVCSPTRGALLSGEYGARTGMTKVVNNKFWPNAPMITPKALKKLPAKAYTVANMLQDAGYATGMSGKWHVGDAYQAGNLKNRTGLDYFKPYGFEYVGDASEDWAKDPDKAAMAITDDILEFINDNRNEPFFAYVSHFTPHTALTAPDSLIQKYLEKGFTKSSNLWGAAEERPTADYLAMLEHLDHTVGRLLSKLDQWSLSESTMIIFISDNGGLNRAWDNDPLRGAKGLLYEAGIRVPMLVRWPDRVPAGRAVDTPVHIIDMFPTFMEAASGSIPEKKILDGKSLLPLFTAQGDLDRETMFWHFPHYAPEYGHTPASVVRKGNYKLFYYFGDYLDKEGTLPERGSPHGKMVVGKKIELFNLKDDPYEQNDISKEMPQITEELTDDLEVWWKETGARMPVKNTDADIENWFNHTQNKER